MPPRSRKPWGFLFVFRLITNNVCLFRLNKNNALFRMIPYSTLHYIVPPFLIKNRIKEKKT